MSLDGRESVLLRNEARGLRSGVVCASQHGPPPSVGHTAATIALTEGIPLHVVAARSGDDARTLLGRYTHLLPHSDEQAAERSLPFSLTNR